MCNMVTKILLSSLEEEGVEHELIDKVNGVELEQYSALWVHQCVIVNWKFEFSLKSILEGMVIVDPNVHIVRDRGEDNFPHKCQYIR